MMVESRMKPGTQLPAARKEATKEATSVIRLPTERLLGEAAALLVPCLGANPNFVDLFREEMTKCSEIGIERWLVT
jgi:hypothetical protein